MNRRQVLLAAIGAAAAVVAARFALVSASAAPLDDHAAHERGEMISRGVYGWESHLLPFAQPLPTAAGVRAELARSRALGLFR